MSRRTRCLSVSLAVLTAGCGAGTVAAGPDSNGSGDAARREAAASIDGSGAVEAPGAADAGVQFVVARGTGLELGGRPYHFKGFDIYNANSVNNCWYTLGQGTALDDSLTTIDGSQVAFRAWFFQYLATDKTTLARDWTAFDHTLAVAAAHGERVIVTLDDQWGACVGPSRGPYHTESWYQTGYRSDISPYVTKTYRDWVAEVVTRYQDDPTILMWQLMNEAEDCTTASSSNGCGGTCSGTASASLKAWALDMATLVKSIDSNHLLSLGSIGGGQCGTAGSAYQDVHSVPGIDLCEYHDYGSPSVPIPGDMWNGLMVRIGQCATLAKPLFVGESGIITSDVGSLAQRAADFDAKFSAQFGAGIVGELVWAWCDSAATSGCNDTTSFDVEPGDPVLPVLAKY